jgi:ubiquinone/menaquinone biosynthesis C-methylase UbiE
MFWDKIFRKNKTIMTPTRDMAWLIPLFLESNANRILDVGAGMGRNAIFLAGKNFDVAAVDFSDAAVEHMASSGINAVRADARKLPFEDESFDALICSHCLTYIPTKDHDKCCNEMGRVLRKGGLIYVRVPSTKHVLCGKRIGELPEGYSQIKEALIAGHDVHFFTETEMKRLFAKRFQTIRLEHRTGKPVPPISFEMNEWLFVGRKK